MEPLGKSTSRPSRKPEKPNSNVYHTPQRRAGTSKMPDEHPMEEIDQPVDDEKKDQASDHEKTARKRRSTFDPKFKGWRGPVHEGSSLARPSCSGSIPASPVSKKSSTSRACTSSSNDQSRPSSSSAVIDNNYYRSIIRRSITSSRQVPRVPIVPRNVSVPNVDWEGVVRIDSRDSCVHRQSAFEWERPDSPDVQRLPRTRAHAQISSTRCASSACVSNVSITAARESRAPQEDDHRTVNSGAARQHGETNVSEVEIQRDIDENGRMSNLIREVIRMKAINSQLKEEISDLKKRDRQNPQ